MGARNAKKVKLKNERKFWNEVRERKERWRS